MAATDGRSDPSERGGLLSDLPIDAVANLVSDVIVPTDHVLLEPRFLPDLAVRHAGSDIFQEAHFELLQTGQRDMLGYIGPAKAKDVTRGGVHFTPPALARSLVEQTLGQLKDLPGRKRLTIFDPACGSAAFLHEALRALERLGFEGQLTLIGYDVSEPAVAMAEFVLMHATRDWQPNGGCRFRVVPSGLPRRRASASRCGADEPSLYLVDGADGRTACDDEGIPWPEGAWGSQYGLYRPGSFSRTVGGLVRYGDAGEPPGPQERETMAPEDA